jgi:class 3 adenylate cyclase/predicted ATPase
MRSYAEDHARKANRNPVMDVGDWLRSLGLGQYEAAFRESEIEPDLLPEVTDQHLKDLGVPLGHRIRILKAIRALGAGGHTAGQPANPEPEPRDTAERRQLTVMFCDLVGSTALAARLDPEDVHVILAAYHQCCAGLIARNGGFVAQYMGDGVLAYFGYPRAHEHDAERAVRAGLAIVEAAPKLETPAQARLRVRVGIATGIVVVGDLLGSGESQERGVVGDTPNLAARLQGIAAPDSVVIAEGTRKLLGDLFELRDLGPQDLKGIAGPTHAWAALRPSAQESRFEALHAGGLSALVGREEEIELLLRRWAKAKAAEGQIVLISGEAGIGKSRLTAALLDRVAGEPHARMRYFCSPQHADSPLYPIIAHMERAAGLARDDDPKTRLDKLDALLAKSSTSPEQAALLTEMIFLPNDGRYPVLDLSPQQRRQRTLEALTTQIDAISRQTAVLMIFEDAQWADPSSLEVFGQLVDKVESLRVLLLVTFRPEFAAPWIGRPHLTALTINRLAPREVMALIDRVAGDKLLASNIRQDIAERADGVPLFVEEMTKAVLEAESEGAAARTIAAVPSPALAVPASLHASLMARLDRLGSAKGIAQIGAAIGREFSHALLAVVSGLSEHELNSALDRLVQSGLVSRQGAEPAATYLFKHALVQAAAYGTLLREPRRALHARIAEAIEGQFRDVAESQPELLARHLTEAGLIERGAFLWGKAGERSLARSALLEAEAQLNRALTQIAGLPGTPALRREEIRLQIALVNVRMHSMGYGASETKASLDRARELIRRAEALGEPPDDPLLLFSVLYGGISAGYIAFDSKVFHELAVQFLELAQRQTATAPLCLGHRAMGIALLHEGDVAGARDHFERAIALYDPTTHRPLATRLVLDIGIIPKNWRALCLWLLGYPDAARAGGIEDARNFGHLPTLMSTLANTSWPLILRGSYAEAVAIADELIALADERRASLWKAMGMLFRGSACALAGDAPGAVPQLTSALRSYRSTGASVSISYFLSVLGKAHAGLGQIDEAWRRLDEATAAMEATGERWYEAEILRTAGEIGLMSSAPDAAKAQAFFERALEISRAQKTRSWELRAATSLARLWRDQGRRAEALDLLAPVYGWFTEGFDTLDLKEARALLDELA